MIAAPTTPRKFVNSIRPRNNPANPPGILFRLNRSGEISFQNGSWMSINTQTPHKIPSIHSTRGQTRSPDWKISIKPHTASSSGTRNPPSPNTRKIPHAAQAPTGPM